AYQDETALQVLPAKLIKHLTIAEDKAVLWQKVGNQHPLMMRFYQLSGEDTADYEQPQRRPRAWRYWAVESNPDGAKDLATALEVVAYDDEQKRPALVESLVGSGRVLLFTTALDGRHLADRYRWNNYWADSSFGMIFANLTVGHVAGDAEKTE